MMHYNYYVYRLKSTKCRKVYIGITNNPRRRLQQHKQVAKHPWKTLTKAGRAVKRYGAHTFSLVVVEGPINRVEAIRLEKVWIKRFGMKRTWNQTRGD